MTTIDKPQTGLHPHSKILGKNGPRLNPLGYGCMGLSTVQGKRMTDEERYALLDRIYESECRFWDSADVYGDNEDLLGSWFLRNPGAREKVFIATKFGNCRDPETGRHSVRNEPAYIHQQCARSLQRLQTDYIDLYYMHRADKRQPIELTIKAMKELQDAGKVRYLGLSEVSADTLRRACKVVHIDAVQVEYSPFSREIEQLGLLAACKELGVAVVAYAPLGKGLLAGSIRSTSDLAKDDMRRMFPRFTEENFYKNIELVDRLKAIASRKECTTSQLTLAWLLASDELVFAIPGTIKANYFDENNGALSIEISEEEDQEVRLAVSSADVAGARYPDAFVDGLFADTISLEEYNNEKEKSRPDQ